MIMLTRSSEKIFNPMRYTGKILKEEDLVPWGRVVGKHEEKTRRENTKKRKHEEKKT